MRKLLIILLCLSLILGVVGCEQPTKIPEGMSKEFYVVILEADKLIQKSIDARFNYLNEDKDYRKLEDSVFNKEKVKKFTKIEKAVSDSLLDIMILIEMHNIDQKLFTSENEYKDRLDKEYQRFKKLLEP